MKLNIINYYPFLLYNMDIQKILNVSANPNLQKEYEEQTKKQLEEMRQNIPTLSLDTLINIVKNCVNYKPAWKHYNKEVVVACDKCKEIIDECVGFDGYDLCLCCVKTIKEENKI